jgi:hypothetical protein
VKRSDQARAPSSDSDPERKEGRQSARTRHAAFLSLLGIAAGHAPLTYNMLIAPEAKQ